MQPKLPNWQDASGTNFREGVLVGNAQFTRDRSANCTPGRQSQEREAQRSIPLGEGRRAVRRPRHRAAARPTGVPVGRLISDRSAKCILPAVLSWKRGARSDVSMGEVRRWQERAGETAHAMRGDRDRCLAAGMDGYLSKPVNAQEMIGLIESLAGGVAPVAHLPAATHGPADTSPRATAVVFNPEEALSRCFLSQEMVREMI